MHNCPVCGEKTNGAWSEGGLKWAICDDCMVKQRQESEREKARYVEAGARQHQRIDIEGDEGYGGIHENEHE